MFIAVRQQLIHGTARVSITVSLCSVRCIGLYIETKQVSYQERKKKAVVQNVAYKMAAGVL
jgi:hypothetical protein